MHPLQPPAPPRLSENAGGRQVCAFRTWRWGPGSGVSPGQVRIRLSCLGLCYLGEVTCSLRASASLCVK